MIAPILLYGSEIWGIYTCKNVDKLQIRFYKYVLGVKKQTPNLAVYAELGNFPLSVLCKERALKFWNKIVANQQSPIYSVYIDQCINGNSKCWTKRIHTTINELGFSHTLQSCFDSNPKYHLLFKQRIRDQFLQNWHDQIGNMSK